LNSGDGSDGLVSHKVGAIFWTWSGTELYVNAGTGFHSNDARGTTIRTDPADGEPVELLWRLRPEPDPLLARRPFVA
jgi:hypothetical protein